MPLALRLGQKVPDFILPDADNKLRSLGELEEQGPVVITFFPFAFSGICDREMCMFRDGFVPLSGTRVHVAAVSVDSVFTLKAFAQTYDLPFVMLSDFNKKVSKLYGVLQETWVALDYKGVAKRSVFVVDQRGMLRYRWITEVPTDEPPYGEIVKLARKLGS
jgi:peroxiredoxin